MPTSSTSDPSYPLKIVETFRRYGAREAFVSGDQRLTYAQCADLVSRVQQVLHDEGITPGTTMVALSPNVPEVFLAQVATWLNGARYSGLHPLGSVEDHVALCDDAQAVVLVAHPAFAEQAAAVAERCGSVRRLLMLGPSDAGADLLELAAAKDPAPLHALPPDDADTVWMIYTGGTTGRSKGVMHGHRSMVQGMLGIAAAWELPACPRYLASGPITHASVLPIAPTLMRGGTVVLNQGFDPDRWIDTVVRERVDYSFVVPTMVYALLDRTSPRDHDLSSLETVAYGSAPMSAARLEEALDVFGPVLMQGYGQSETLGLATVLRRDEHDPKRRPDLLTSCGQPVPGAQLAILDDDGTELGVDEPGELCLRAGFTMIGYWNQPQRTAEALAGGWLHTGDIARRDEEGFVHIVDRKNDMIISGAFNIYPRDIEEVIAADADVSSVAVIGVPDDKWGEAVTALVVPRPGGTVDVERLKLAVRERRGAHQVPKQVHLVDALPLTALGKVDKLVIRAQYWDGATRAVN